MAIHPAEAATIRAFVVRAKRDRYLSFLGNEKRRRKFLDCLNHCRDLDDRFATVLPSAIDVVQLLESHGAPSECWVISDNPEIDRRDMALAEAVAQLHWASWGTILSCIPGRLAYYRDEAGTKRHLVLIRPPEC